MVCRTDELVRRSLAALSVRVDRKNDDEILPRARTLCRRRGDVGRSTRV
jgi:hypothetical protein